MNVTLVDLAMRFVGTKEVAGTASNPLILAMLNLDEPWPASDEVPWCSAFLNWLCWLLRLPRSKSLQARSWLEVGIPVDNVGNAKVGWDVVVLWRGDRNGPTGHVGIFMGYSNGNVHLLGGNQGDAVSVSTFPSDKIIGIRRLYDEA